jgi:DNA-directed RNA polymerase specialized sigma24 family protein
MSRARTKKPPPLTAAQHEVVLQLLPVAELVGKRAWRTKWRPPCATSGDYRDETLLPLMEWVSDNTNADGTDPRQRPPKLYRAHCRKRLSDRLGNHRMASYRYLKGKREMKQELARSQGSRKKRPWITYEVGWDAPLVVCSGPVWEKLSHKADGDPALAHVDVRDLVTVVLRQMSDVDPEVALCFKLRYGAGMKFQEIADCTGLSEAQVKRRVKKADEIAQKFKEEHDREFVRNAG